MYIYATSLPRHRTFPGASSATTGAYMMLGLRDTVVSQAAVNDLRNDAFLTLLLTALYCTHDINLFVQALLLMISHAQASWHLPQL